MDYYRDLTFLQKIFVWFMVLFTMYMIWQVGIRPFFNN